MKTWKRNSLLGSFMFLISVCLALPTLAEEAVEQPDKQQKGVQQARKACELEPMTVTAEKREENIQDVPASVTALSEIQIEDANIKSTNEIHTFIPNFTTFKLGNGGFSYYSIRGQTNFIQYSRSVGIYIDDVPVLIGDNTTDSRIYDIERIEVLRGPQGNLYGMNTAGGVVNVIKSCWRHWGLRDSGLQCFSERTSGKG
jgi:iron complex outermembrane receptor protein